SSSQECHSASRSTSREACLRLVSMVKKFSQADQPLLIVALGASAGGVPPLRQFLSALGEPSKLAFILVQHLSDEGSNLAHEVLVHQTKLEVIEIKAGQKLRAGCIFHAPAHALVDLNDGVFEVKPAEERPQQFTTIDHMMASVARDQGE